MSDYNITDLLSPAFLERMRKMLGDEYEDFIKSYEAPSCRFRSRRSCGFRTDIFILKMSVLLSVLSIRQDFIICRSQVP